MTISIVVWEILLWLGTKHTIGCAFLEIEFLECRVHVTMLPSLCGFCELSTLNLLMTMTFVHVLMVPVSYEIIKLLSSMLRPPDFSANPRRFTSIPDHLTSAISKDSNNRKLAPLLLCTNGVTKVMLSVVCVCVCVCVCVWPQGREVFLYRAQPPSVRVPVTTVTPQPHPCSTLFTMHLILSARGQLAFNWNAFLSYISFSMKGRSDMSLLTLCHPFHSFCQS